MSTLLQEALTQLEAGQHSQARKLLITALKQDPDEPRAWRAMLSLAKNQAEKDECLKQIRRLEKSSKTSAKPKTDWAAMTFILGGLFVIVCLVFSGLAIAGNAFGLIPGISFIPTSQTGALPLSPAPMPTLTNRAVAQLTETPTPPIQVSPTTVPTVKAVDGCPPAQAPRQTGMVLDVLDGARIVVKIGDETHTVKYLGVAIIHETSYAELPKQRNAELTQGRRVTLVTGPYDKALNGDLLRYVFVGDTFVNLEVLRQGYLIWERKDLLDEPCRTVFVTAAKYAEDNYAGYFANYATSQARQQATLLASQPSQVAQPQSTNVPAGSTNQDICNSPSVLYAKEVHRINLNYLEDYYQPWFDYYERVIQNAVINRDAVTIDQARQNLEKIKSDYTTAVDQENQNYRAAVPKACR
jgi:endonuclease YncB( thermonuclease family)